MDLMCASLPRVGVSAIFMYRELIPLTLLLSKLRSVCNSVEILVWLGKKYLLGEPVRGLSIGDRNFCVILELARGGALGINLFTSLQMNVIDFGIQFLISPVDILCELPRSP